MPALAKPNFSGDWKLDATKSTFGQMPAPSSMAAKITHDDPKLINHVKMSGDNGDFETDSKYTTDGQESANEMFGSPVKSTVKWDGDTLSFDTKGSFGGNDFSMQDKWTLSADGKTLPMLRHFKSGMGEGDQKLVFVKQ